MLGDAVDPEIVGSRFLSLAWPDHADRVTGAGDLAGEVVQRPGHSIDLGRVGLGDEGDVEMIEGAFLPFPGPRRQRRPRAYPRCDNRENSP